MPRPDFRAPGEPGSEMRNLLKRLLGADAGVAAEAMAPPDTGRQGPVYAVGDIHGRSDLLVALLQKIEEDAATFAGDPLTVFVGDYVDRGDHSREVLECLTLIEAEGPSEIVFLRGNHEQMMLDFMELPGGGGRWLRFGGLATLMSYGIRGVGGTASAENLADLRERLLAAVDPAHAAFLGRLPHFYQVGNVLFTHAGADPAREPDMQDPETLMWGAPEFGRTARTDGLWVVHGHTIVDAPSAARGVISIDTGAYVTGRLTAARIHDGEVAFLST